MNPREKSTGGQFAKLNPREMLKKWLTKISLTFLIDVTLLKGILMWFLKICAVPTLVPCPCLLTLWEEANIPKNENFERKRTRFGKYPERFLQLPDTAKYFSQAWFSQNLMLLL